MLTATASGRRETHVTRAAVAIPAYNESEGIGDFLLEIDEALASVDEVVFVVADDCSTDATLAVLETVRGKLRAELVVLSGDRNRGHGPTLLAAYRGALDTGAEYVVAVDGDGQFLGSDVRRVLVLLEDGGEGVCGVRRFRYDPWFRMLMTRVLRLYVGLYFGVPTRDANCPLRGYRSELLDALLRWIPDDSLVPNLNLAVLAARRGATLVEVDVSHRVRRGTTATGTMFGGASALRTIGRLLGFSWRALQESRQFHHDVNSGRRPQLDARRA
jgi:dolichol-phosphate mannosyltransferase